MKLSTWRTTFLSWLQAQVVVDSWSVTDPEMGNTNAFLPPLEDTTYTLRDTQVIGEATQRFQIAKRVPRTTKYRDIALNTYEGLHSTLSIRLVHDYRDIADLEDLTFIETPNPIGLAEVGEDTGEWLISFLWVVKITWIAEPEVGSVVKPFNFNRLNLNLYRDRLDDDLVVDGRDLDKSVLDFTHTFE